MIRVGNACDKENAVSLCKTINNGQYAAGFVLAGYGTQPMPGTICDNAVQKTVAYAAHYIQITLDVLLEQGCSDMEYAKTQLYQQLSKLNNNIAYVNRNIGQGTYLAGAICYTAGEKYICLPFGGAHAFYWDGAAFQRICNKAVPESEVRYIWDALGGASVFPAIFSEGELPIGTQILCSTQEPSAELLQSVMSSLLQTDPKNTTVAIHHGMDHTDLPLAILDIAQMATAKKEALSNDEETAS